jgi:hypothetical protein
VEPLLADVTANPELILPIVVTARATTCLPMLFHATASDSTTILAGIQGFLLAVFVLHLRLGLLGPRFGGFLL